MKKFIENIVENEPPYKEFKVTEWDLEKIVNVNSFSITQYCSICDKVCTFKCVNNPFYKLREEYEELKLDSYFLPQFVVYLKNADKSFILAFHCQHDCSEKHYCALHLKNLSIQKIGQYPSFTKEAISEKLRKYKNLIPQYYPELTKAVSAYSQNMSVAAFVYLRRILEHLVDKKYSAYSGNPEGIKFIDKLNEVEKHEKIIPDELKEIKSQIYAVLSKGVHEYKEEECTQLFPAVQFVIEAILDEQLAAAERKRKAAETKKVIADKLKGSK